MVKNLSGYVTGLVLLAPIVIFVTPLLYGMAWLMAVGFPLAVLFSTIDDLRSGSEPRLTNDDIAMRVFALVAAPVALIAFAAPLRAVMLAALSFFPEGMAKFNEIHEYLYDLFVPVFGYLSPYWIDVYWGFLGMGLIFLLALGDSMRRNKLNRQIEILPTSTTRSVAIGLAELKGNAVPLGRKPSNQAIIREWRESSSDGSSICRHIEPFLLDDGTGRILVDPRGVFIKGSRSYFGVGLHQAILEDFDPGTGFPESRLMPGDTVFLVGSVQMNSDPEYADYGSVVVKPKKSSLFSMNFYDLFFLSNISEESLLDGFRKSIKRGWRNVVIGMAFGAWLSIFALTNLIQIESSDIEAAPEYLRLVSTPTTLEREIGVSGVGRGPTLDFVKVLEEGDPEKTDSIMQKFRDYGLTYLALPILRTQAVNIEHPGFGIASYWLSKLNANPKEHWGAEIFNESQMHDNNHYVRRLKTRYEDNRLFVTYRALVRDLPPSKRFVFEGRHVVIELTNKETGKEYEATFKTHMGVNAADDVEAFEYLPPGEYEIAAYVRTSYRGGVTYRGFMTRRPFQIRLKE